MKKHFPFLLFFLSFLCVNQVYPSEDNREGLRSRILALVLEDLEQVDPDVVSLEPMVISEKQPIGLDSRSRIQVKIGRYLDKIGRNDSRDMFSNIRLPFAFDSIEEQAPRYMHIPNAKTFRMVHGGIRISDTATLYFSTGLLWGTKKDGTWQFYLPFRYRSSVGFGWKKKF